MLKARAREAGEAGMLRERNSNPGVDPPHQSESREPRRLALKRLRDLRAKRGGAPLAVLSGGAGGGEAPREVIDFSIDSPYQSEYKDIKSHNVRGSNSFVISGRNVITPNP